MHGHWSVTIGHMVLHGIIVCHLNMVGISLCVCSVTSVSVMSGTCGTYLLSGTYHLVDYGISPQHGWYIIVCL